MKRKRTVIKHLEMMGYTVGYNDIDGYIRISLMMKSGTYVSTLVYYDDICKDYVIESAVRRINDTIMNNI